MFKTTTSTLAFRMAVWRERAMAMAWCLIALTLLLMCSYPFSGRIGFFLPTLRSGTEFPFPESSFPLFAVEPSFHFPHLCVLPIDRVLEAEWVKELKIYLRSIYPARIVTLTFTSAAYIPNLLNWLISAYLVAEPPLENVVTVAFDRKVYSLLRAKKLAVIYIPYSSTIDVNYSHFKKASMVWMTRLAVIRLLNHWGYDVQHFDNDAIILKNPKSLFDKYSEFDIVGSKGRFPFELGRGPWRFTLCMGAVLLRATQKMGKKFHLIRL